MATYNITLLVSGYQSIDMHCIVLPVKFDGGLSISVLRNKQLFKINGRQKFSGKWYIGVYFLLAAFEKLTLAHHKACLLFLTLLSPVYTSLQRFKDPAPQLCAQMTCWKRSM
jgi:hypothetical protein